MRRARLVDRLRTRGTEQTESDAQAPRPERSPESQWFWDHYEMAAGEIVTAFQAAGAPLAGRRVADVGCGDGIMDLGVVSKGRPRELVGFDLNPTDTDHLFRRAREEGVTVADPSALRFARSEPGRIPAEDASFELAFSWSAFEHVSEPTAVLTEIRRILAPDGAFFLQLWPFYHSAKGSHLWEWFPEDFHHLQRPESAIVRELEASERKPADWTQMMSREFQHLNRITVEELQRCMVAAGFVTRRVELIAHPTMLTPELARYSWLDLGVSGIKLIATPR